MMQHVTITSTRYHRRYCTFSLSLTWLGYNLAHYHNFNVLPHALPYIFFKFGMVWGYLQHVTMCYRQIYKKLYINIFFKKITVACGNALQASKTRQISEKIYGNVCDNVFKLW